MGLCGLNAPDCTSWRVGGGTPPKLKADPDIAGLGIILAFLLTSLVALCFTFGSLVFTILPGFDENSIDLVVTRNLRRFKILNISHEKRKFWRAVVEKVILSLGDQQLLTGIAILVSGMIRHCTISVYHFAIISDLAWFSSYVHLQSLLVLQDFLRDRPQLRNWRVCLMLVMFVLLFAYTVIESHWEWYESWQYEAQCVFDDLIGNVGGLPGVVMSVNIFFLVTYYSWAILCLYTRPSEAFISWVYDKPLDSMAAGIILLEQRRAHSDRRWNMVPVRVFYSVLLFGLIIIRGGYIVVTALLGSQYLDFMLGLIWAAIGLWGLVNDRSIGRADMEGNENDMTFGQLVPLLLLSSTLVTFKEAYDDAVRVRHRDRTLKHNSSVTTLLTPNITQGIEMSGGLVDNDDDLAPMPEPFRIRRTDTERGGRAETFFTGHHHPNLELQRRSMFPRLSQSEPLQTRP